MIEGVFKLAMIMDNPYDYDGLVELCKQHFHTPPDITHYFQKIGLIMGAKFKYKQLLVDEAYDELLKTINVNQPAGCKSCGKDKQISDGGNIV